MNIYAQEVLNRDGQKMLDTVLKMFGNSFFIVGSDTEQLIIGDGDKNVTYSRKTGKQTSVYRFNSSRKLSRK